MGDSFCFIVDGINFEGELPLEVIPGHWFRKANTEEIQYIKRELAARRVNLTTYESKSVAGEKEGSWQFIQLPPEEWKYYVISFDGWNDKIRDIEHSANLLKHDLSIGFTFSAHEGTGGYSISYNPFITSTFFTDQIMGNPQQISLESSELFEISANHGMIANLDKRRYANTFRAIVDFYETKMITNRSMLKVLSYFSIIECLLTHVPSPTDTIDSLTRQVSTKMSLLSKLFQRELDYVMHFPQLSAPERAWKKLYDYRSAIAHGGEADFNGKFTPLVSRDNIQEFLKESLKLLLLYTLREPDFIADLQKC